MVTTGDSVEDTCSENMTKSDCSNLTTGSMSKQNSLHVINQLNCMFYQ